MNNVSVVYINSDYHITQGASDYLIIVQSNDLKVYLPSLANMPVTGFFVIKNFDVTNTQVIPQAGELIDNLDILYLYGTLDMIWLWTAGVRWIIGGLGRPRENVVTMAGNYTMVPADSTVIQTVNNSTITLPSSTNIIGVPYWIKNGGTSSVKITTIKPPTGEKLDGVVNGTYVTAKSWESVRFMSDGTQWYSF